MSLTPPPFGARVRHTTTYPDGTAVTVEGFVAPNANHNQTAQPYLLIGAELLVAYLADRPGEHECSCGASWSVRDVPAEALPAEPVEETTRG